ncbi:MAG: ABC transporter substrate-binding protein [Chloroflexi bacterium]|nr:ABC transporter substrate-binding protein [Chloroflexota bacterium]
MSMSLRFPAPLLLLAALVVAVSALAAACGDDEEEQFRIGVLVDFSGPIAEFAEPTMSAFELAVLHINEAGGVNGQEVVLVTGDTRVDPTQGVEEARRLIDVEGVHAIVGPLSSTVTLAVVSSVAREARIPVISPSATSPALSTANDDGYLFRTTISDAAQGAVLAQLAADEGLTSVGVLFRDDAYGQGLSDAFAEAFDGDVAAVAYAAKGQPSYLAELQQAAAGGAEVLVAIAFPEEAQVFLREAIEQGIFTRFLFVDGTRSEELIGAIGAEHLNGSRGTAPGSGPATPASDEWDASYLAEYGELPSTAFLRESYDAVIAVALAAQAAGSTNGIEIRDHLTRIATPGGATFLPGPDGVRAALEAAGRGDDINYEGAATNLDWDDVGDVTSGYIEIWEYRDGAIVTLRDVPFSVE